MNFSMLKFFIPLLLNAAAMLENRLLANVNPADVGAETQKWIDNHMPNATAQAVFDKLVTPLFNVLQGILDFLGTGHTVALVSPVGAATKADIGSGDKVDTAALSSASSTPAVVKVQGDTVANGKMALGEDEKYND